MSDSKVQNILKIPISSLRVTDRLVWSASRDGQYSVDLGYRLAKTCHNRNKHEEGMSRKTGAEKRRMWNKIWSLKIKKKVHHFILKACHNRILVSVNLKKRGVDIDETCKHCGKLQNL